VFASVMSISRKAHESLNIDGHVEFASVHGSSSLIWDLCVYWRSTKVRWLWKLFGRDHIIHLCL